MFGQYIGEKYRILGEEADARDRLAKSQSALTDTQTQLAPGESLAKNYATVAQGNQANSLGNYYGVRASLAPSETASENSLRQAQSASSLSQAGLFDQESRLALPNFNLNYGTQYGNRDADRSRLGISQQQLDESVDHFASGSTRVPGRGDGTVDTQPAMLAPGEAVLNKAAAEHLGRGVIDMLNAIGAHKMGLDLNPHQAHGQTPGEAMDTSTPAKGSKTDSGQKVNNQTGGTPGYAKGTSKVPGKGAKGKAPPSNGGGAPAPGPMSPEIMQAILKMGAGGSPTMGMQPPGQQPMPMPMPPVAR